MVTFYEHYAFCKRFSGSVFMSSYYMLSDPLSLSDFVGSAHTQFIYFTLSKNCGNINHQNRTWILAIVCWTQLRFSLMVD